MTKYFSASESLSTQEQMFCDVYLHTGDVAHAFKVSGIPLDFGRSEVGQGNDLLNKQAVKDYILMLGSSDSNDMESSIKRLEVISRQAWRKGDLQIVKDVEVQIVSLRCWLIERAHINPTNV